MKIYGPYTRKDGRKHIIIIQSNGTRVTKSYPRYLMEQSLGRNLLPEETIDHINNDYTDDRIENLQLLSAADNARKEMTREHRQMEYYEFTCPVCNKEAKKKLYVVRANRKQNKSGPYCSKSCAGKA